MRRKVLVALTVSLCGEIYLIFHLPVAVLVFMFLIGKSDCSLKETVTIGGWWDRYREIAQALTRDSHILSREGPLELWTTPMGQFWMPADEAPQLVDSLTEQKMRIYGLGRTGVSLGDTVLDCGADIGTFTRLALDMGASIVVAVEPAPAKWTCLERNFEHEIAAGRVRIARLGVWSEKANSTLSRLGTASSVALYKSPAVDTIALTTIDSLVAELQLNRVDLIKMDIEGAEKQALEGGKLTLRRFKPKLAISCEHFADDARQIPRIVQSAVPQYVLECGHCAYQEGRFRPQVLFFR